MSDISNQSSETSYNQRIIAVGTDTDVGSEQQSRNGGGGEKSNGGREQSSTEKTVRTGDTRAASTDQTDSESSSERTAENTRNLQSKSIQVTRNGERANIAMRISFSVPIRGGLPDVKA